MACNYSSKYCK